MAVNSGCDVEFPAEDFKTGERFAELEEPLQENEPVKKKSKSGSSKKLKRLTAENDQLKYKMRMLIEPKDIHIEDDHCDGPIAQVIFMNHRLVRKYRQDIEDFFENLSTRIVEEDQTYDELHPQRSSVLLFRNNQEKQLSVSAIGNVQYYNQFCIDKIGKPLCNGNPRLTVGWRIPDYEQMYTESLPVDEQPVGNKRQKACCFNCGEDDHGVRDCPQPQDLVRISMNKKKFMSSMQNTPTSKRYHLDEDNIEKFKPGHLSDELRNALGLNPNQLPLHIYQMRVHNYPPGHLKDAEVVKSGLTVYDNHEEGESVDYSKKKEYPSYEHDKLISYPGFNVDIPSNMIDECERYRMPPMQRQHRLEAYKRRLPTPNNKHTSKKRSKNFADDESVDEMKRRRIEERQEENMEISVTDSDIETNCPSADENFKPPLPPTPGYATPPPLPSSTPPPTPGKTPNSESRTPPIPPTPDYVPPPPLPTSTPPSTPGRTPGSSPQVQDTSAPLIRRTPSCGSLESDANNMGSFSPYSAATSQEGSRGQSPTLDDLEQQRLNLLSAFDDGGDTEGTSDTGEMINVNGQLFTITDTVDGSDQPDTEKESANEDNNSQSCDIDSADQTSVEEGEITVQDPGYSSQKTDDEENDHVVVRIPKPDDLTPNKSGVPHWSKFSKDISPHPPDENLMESTGVFKRLCSILKRKKNKDA